MRVKNLTRRMMLDLGRKCNIKPLEKYGYRINNTEVIEVVNKETGESRIINKRDYNFNF